MSKTAVLEPRFVDMIASADVEQSIGKLQAYLGV